jgi:hypothetical protein
MLIATYQFDVGEEIIDEQGGVVQYVRMLLVPPSEAILQRAASAV